MLSLGLNYDPLLPAVIPAYVIYVLLFGVAIWSTFQDSLSPRKWLRIPLLAMLLVLTSTFLINIIQDVDSTFVYRADIMQVTLNVATCLAGVLSDGLLAWRCFVLFGKRPWMKWLLVVLIALDFSLGSLSNIAYGLQIREDEKLLSYLELVNEKIGQRDNLAQELSDVWAWLFFALNTTMTMSIIYKVFSSANRTKALTGPYKDHYIYNTVIRAIIESALIVWMGLLTYAIATTCWFALVAANPNTTYNTPLTAIYGAEDASSIAFTILPFIFGISQSLIIARIGFSRLRALSSAVKRTALVFASDHRAVEEKEPISSVLDICITRNVGDIEMCTTDSSTLA